MSEEYELPSVPAALLLAEIDVQQDDLLRQLDELNERVEKVLLECAPPKDRGAGVPVCQAIQRKAA